MSNGGAFVHQAILQLLREDWKSPSPQFGHDVVRIVGVVFDSAPAYLTFDSGSRAVSEGIKNSVVRNIIYLLARLLMPLLLLLVMGFSAPKRYFDELIADPLTAPVLYIYSTHDELTDFAKLDDLVEQRRRRHVGGEAAVRVLRLGPGGVPSPHVAHLARHPDLYRKALQDFLSLSLQ